MTSSTLTKADLLSKFREPDEDIGSDTLGLEKGDDVELSYLKFSHLLALSVFNGESRKTSSDSGNSDGRSQGQSQTLAQSHHLPFLRKIQMLVLNIEIDTFPHRAMESIHEDPRPPRGTVADKESRQNSLDLHSRKSGGSGGAQKGRKSAPPDPSRPQRKGSVKVSLTPAQRVEKRPGIRTRNALDDFEFHEKIGRGAYADVYRAMNVKTHKVVAIKQIGLERDYNPSALMGEIDLLKILKHPNIVKYHGFVKTLASLNVFLEFCAGGSLRQIYKKQGHGFGEAQIVSYVTPILRGLQYLHEQGVVHRDVKAANVLLTGLGEVKLADFGVATKVLTLHNTVVGTPNWMAPETVLGGDGLCTASDIWSLGATIIELYTTNPPYHELNPMATLHAIGTDEHPVLPPGLSAVAKDFLLECFQKQSNLRVSAQMLLKHRWVSSGKREKGESGNESKQNSCNQSMGMVLVGEGARTAQYASQHKAVANDSLSGPAFDPSILLRDAQEGSAELTPGTPVLHLGNTQDSGKGPGRNPESQAQSYTRAELLAKFSENDEPGLGSKSGESEVDHSHTFAETSEPISTVRIHNALQKQMALALAAFVEEHDPFFALDIPDFDSSELEVQEKTAFLLAKLQARVASCHLASDEALNTLEKITGRMLHLVKKHPASHEVLVRDHGILTLMELLENALDVPDRPRLWHHVLGTLNHVLGGSPAQIENFALLGGIPMITRFSKASFGLAIRTQVVRFVQILRTSEKALLMFVSSGGLRILSRFLEEDFETTPDFALVAVHCIHEILAKDLTRFKSDMCRILSKHGIVFWFVVLLGRLAKCTTQAARQKGVSPAEADTSIDRILEVIRYFAQSEAKVRVNISSPDLFKLLIKVYPSLSFARQMEILRFFKALSCISELLRLLHSADILEFYVGLLRQYTPAHPQYKEVMNILCPSLYNCCYLNHSRERELAMLGAVPLLRDLCRTNLPFRQFVLPILCELVYCDASVRALLLKHDIPTIYFNLLVDPYWHYNVMDLLLHWAAQNEGFSWLKSATAQNCLVAGFMMHKVSNLEAVLENYLELMTKNEQVIVILARDTILENILHKLALYAKAPAAKLSLLRILHALIIHASDVNKLRSFRALGPVKNAMGVIVAKDSSVLAKDLANRIVLAL